MSESADKSLLARLVAGGEGGDPCATLAATQPDHDGAGDVDPPVLPVAEPPRAKESPALNDIRAQISNLIGGEPVQPQADSHATADAPEEFVPIEPASLSEAQLTEADIEALVLKYLLNTGSATGRGIAEQVKLPFKLMDGVLREMKTDQLVFYRNTSSMNDYEYSITDLGRERARRLYEQCTYFGAAPVSLGEYVASVRAQSLTRRTPTLDDLRAAFSDLLLNQRMLNRLGPAVNSGRGLFLYGAPGNGKTSIAERVTKAFGQQIWVPRALGIDGEIIRVYDPEHHEDAPLANRGDGLLDSSHVDRRWVRIRRPTIIAGGELTMENLEVSVNRTTGISEAPLQMKSNCGTLVIDDFGRQRIQIDELLNRWIVPLEKRYDLLNLASGKKIQVPFDQLIVFSTNLEPRELVDEAFLRRIPYKIEVTDPSEQEFRDLFEMMSGKLGFVYREKAVDYVIQKHYQEAGRSFRCCHPRDLLLQVQNFCRFQNIEPEMTKAYFDYAVENYFAVM